MYKLILFSYFRERFFIVIFSLSVALSIIINGIQTKRHPFSVTDRKLRVKIHKTEKGQWQIFHVYFEHRENYPGTLCQKKKNLSFFLFVPLDFMF